MEIQLAGGYPLTHVDRLVGQLLPLIELDEPVVLTLNLERLAGFGPTALALLTAVILRVTGEGLLLAGSEIVHPRSWLTWNYLMRMDFVRLVAVEGEEPFERHEAVGFRPCRPFGNEQAYHEVAGELTNALAERCQTDAVARNSIRIALDEVCENVIQHADSSIGGVAAAQGSVRKKRFELGIVDLGVGIRGSLSKNPRYADIGDDVAAIEKAMEPRVTSTPERNSGIGLFITRLLLGINGGTFAIRSGRGAVYTGSRERVLLREVEFPGTMVALQARTDQPLDIHEVYRRLDDPDNGDGHDDD